MTTRVAYDADHTYALQAALAAAHGAPDYADYRRRLARAEDSFAASVVCDMPGMPTVTEKQLARHEQLYGSEGVEELLSYLLTAETSKNGLANDGGKRPLRPATSEDDSVPWETPRKRNLGLRIVALHRRGRGAMAIATPSVRLTKSSAATCAKQRRPASHRPLLAGR